MSVSEVSVADISEVTGVDPIEPIRHASSKHIVSKTGRNTLSDHQRGVDGGGDYKPGGRH